MEECSPSGGKETLSPPRRKRVYSPEIQQRMRETARAVAVYRHFRKLREEAGLDEYVTLSELISVNRAQAAAEVTRLIQAHRSVGNLNVYDEKWSADESEAEDCGPLPKQPSTSTEGDSPLSEGSPNSPSSEEPASTMSFVAAASESESTCDPSHCEESSS